VLGDVEVLGVVEVAVEPVLDAVDDARLQVDQQRARDVVLVVRLVEKHILPVVSVSSILLQYAFRVDTMLVA
jgi:hypothetical protein